MNQSPVVLRGGRVLTEEGLVDGDVRIEDGIIANVSSSGSDRTGAGDIKIEADGAYVLPGIVDIHGDAFERQVMPRPKVTFPLDIALHDSDRQMVANGITTAFHGLTVSWEPGLRSLEAGQAFVAALDDVRPQLRADTRLHIRWETFALDAVETVEAWLDHPVAPVFAFNDHTTGSFKRRTDQTKLRSWAERAGIGDDEYRARLDRVWQRQEDVGPAIARLAAAATARNVAMLSHDDASPEMRLAYRQLGCRVAEFPLTWETAEAARANDEHVVFGAPNVVRGGSHIGAVVAADAAEAGVCTVLASDYYYPAPLVAAFRLVADGRLPLERAWPIVSANPAAAAGLPDRGRIQTGLRGDIIVVDAKPNQPPCLRASVIGGQLAFMADRRLH